MIKIEVFLSLVLTLAASSFAALYLWDQQVRVAEDNRIVIASEKKATIRAHKAEKAIVAARKPGALNRLRSDPSVCPDCAGIDRGRQAVPVVASPAAPSPGLPKHD